MQQKSFIFDLDGTIWDSRPWYGKVITHFSEGSICTVNDQLAKEVNSFRLANSYGIQASQLVRVAKDRTCGTVTLYEGVIPTLRRLNRTSTPVGVVSNLPGRLATSLMESTGISQYIDSKYVVTYRRGLPSKPHPQGIRQLISNMVQDCVSHEIWFVGDTESDAQAADSAGVKFAWASYGYGLKQPESSDRVLQRFDELLDL